MEVILVADFGSSNVRVHAVDGHNGTIVAQHSIKYPLISPKPGYFEHDPEEMWQKSVLCVAACVKELGKDATIRAISFSHVGSSLVPLGEDLRPTYNCILGMDSRAGADGQKLKESFIQNGVPLPDTAFTFADISPMAKILHLRRTEKEAAAKTRYYVSIQQYILTRLGLPLVWDATEAGSHACFDAKNGRWAADVLDIVGIKKEELGDIVASHEVLGTITQYGDVAFSSPVPVVIGGHDAAMGTLGLGVYDETQDVIAEVTGSVDVFCFLMNRVQTFTEEEQNAVRPGSLLMSEPGPLRNTTLCLSGYKTAGVLIEWYLREMYGASNGYPYADLWSKIQLDGQSRVMINPNFAANGGAIYGLDLSITRYDVFKACIEALTYESTLLLNNCAKMKAESCNRVRIGGGHSRAEQWVQLRANVSGKTFERMENEVVSALGTAVLAAYGTGLYGTLENAIQKMVRVRDRFVPDDEYAGVYARQLQKYMKLV